MSLLSLRLPLLLAQRLLILLLQAPSLKRLWTQIASIVLPSLFLCTPTRSLHQRQHQRHLPVMKPLHSDWATQNGIRGLTICDVAMQQQQQPQQQQQQRRRFPLLPQQHVGVGVGVGVGADALCGGVGVGVGVAPRRSLDMRKWATL